VRTSVCCVRWAVLVAALGTVLFAQEPPPGDACTTTTQGTLWPSEANADRQVARRLIQSGELYMCRAKARLHKWELLGVHISALEAAGARKKAPPPPNNDDAYAVGLRMRLARR
jgi:hypothetical protein